MTIIVLACLSIFYQEQGKTPQLHFNESGFSISPLERKSDNDINQVLMMFLPTTDGFAPNVGVQIQKFDGSLDEYIKLTRKQFESADIVVLSEIINKTNVIWEYTGPLGGNKLHWLAIAKKGDKRVFLATATALDSQWNAVSAELKRCLNSFTITKD